MSYKDPSADVAAWLSMLGPTDKKTVQALRRLILAIIPEANEIIYHGALSYSTSQSGQDRVAYVAVCSFHINLGFFFGKSLKDPNHLLAGTGKHMRHVKITSSREIDEQALSNLLSQAWAIGTREVEQLPAPKTV